MTSQTRKRKHTANKKYRKLNRNLRTRTKDIDQVHADLTAGYIPSIEEDLPGGEVLKLHLTTKPHKRRLKEALKNPYTEKDAEAAAEMTQERQDNVTKECNGEEADLS